MVQKGYAQRVYANAQQSSSTPLLASVSNADRAIDLPDTSNYSTLNVPIGALGAIWSHQNIQFSNNPPTASTPVMVKFGTSSSLLNLLGGFEIQRTKGGRTTLVTPSYSDGELLNLLNLFGGSNIGIAIIPADQSEYDGVRLHLNSVLSLGLSANYYYAFYIRSPSLSVSNISLCEGGTGALAIANIQQGYTYRIYSAAIGGTQMGLDITSNSIPIPADLAAGTYWVEAREGNTYPSARTSFSLSRHPRPAAPTVPAGSVCAGTAFTLQVTNPVAGISYRWYSSTESNSPLATGSSLILSNPQTTTTYHVDAINNTTGCISATRSPVTLTVSSKPQAPQIKIQPHSNY